MGTDLHIPDLEFEERLRQAWPTAERCLARVYGERDDFAAWLAGISRLVTAFAEARPPELRLRDLERRDRPDWWREGRMVGYSAYVDRFAGNLTALTDRLAYLQELGVSYLHLLPLFRAREGESDGGFAVADFGEVDPRLGCNADLERLARACRQGGMSLVLDLVCNHTSDDHPWAKAARAGDPEYQSYFRVLRTIEEVRACERDLVDVFPDVAPGNFTYSAEMDGWVWTTFYPFQWDLNYANPAVFGEMLAAMLRLANLGVEGLRLDSTPFLWKRPGTDCRNQPEVHELLAAWRALLTVAAPSVALKAEAIERLADVMPYFGRAGRPAECDLAYNNGAMTAIWAALALGTAEPARALLAASAAKPPGGAWVNYVRCHDDIIWAALSPYVSLEDQAFCSRFFAGAIGSSFSSGAAFQGVPGAAPSTNGMTRSLVGIVDEDPDSLGARRLLLLYAVIYALDGVPVIWMGDEVGLGDDEAHDASDRRDGRWLQRPFMDWRRAAERTDPDRLAGRVFQRLASLARLRAELPVFCADHVARPLPSGDPAVLSFVRGDGGALMQCLANFSPEPRSGASALDGAWSDLLGGQSGEGPAVPLEPYQARWLVAER